MPAIPGTDAPPVGLETLPATAQRLYRLIKNFSKRKGFCFGKQETLAENMGVSVRTIGRALSALHSAGLVEIDRTGRYNECRVIDPEEGPVSDQIGHNVRSDQPKCPISSDTDENLPYKSLNLEEYLEEGPAPEHPRTLEELANRHAFFALPDEEQSKLKDEIRENAPLFADDEEALTRESIALMRAKRTQERLQEEEKAQRLIQLADKAAFLSGSAQSPTMTAHWHSHLADMIANGFTLEQLEAEIDEGKGPHGTRRSEPPWDFKRRLEGTAGKAKAAAADPFAGWRAAAASLAD